MNYVSAMYMYQKKEIAREKTFYIELQYYIESWKICI